MVYHLSLMYYFKNVIGRIIAAVAMGAGLAMLSGVAWAGSLFDAQGLQPQPIPLVAVQSKTKVLQPAPALLQEPSSADIVNKMLSPGPSDPNVPLPRAGLNEQTAESLPAKRATVYGRGEDGGGVLGLKVPIPADRTGS